MTVSSQTNNETFVGNGVTTDFPLPFRFFSNSHVFAYFIDHVTGTSTPMSLGTDYTLSGAGEPEVDGNAVSVLVTTTPLANLRGMYVERVMPLVQETDIVNQGEFFASTHEDVFDRLTMLIQQRDSTLNKVIRVAVNDPEPQRLPAAQLRAGKFMAFDLHGDPTVLAGIPALSQDLVSIKAFGAVGNGLDDDTLAVQAALDSGFALFVPPGNYKLTSTLTVKVSNFYMMGAGPMSRFIHAGDYGDTLRVTDPAGLAVVENVVIMDVMFQHDTAFQATNGTQLKLDAVRNFWLRGVHIQNGFRGFSNLGSDQGHVDGMYVLFDHDNGGLTTGRRYIETLPTANTGKGSHPGDVFITNSNFRGSSSSYCGIGFYMTAGDGIWLNNSHVGSCTQHTLHVNADNATKCTGLLVDNCWIDFGNGATGVRFQGSTPAINGNHYIRNCKLLGGDLNTNGVDMDGSAVRIRVTDCEISDFLGTGVNIRSAFTGTVTIKDNVIRDCARAGAGTANGITYAPDVRAEIVGNIISGPNHASHINIQGTKTRASVDFNDLIPPVTGSLMSTLVGTSIRQIQNKGFNPTGTQSVTVGASPWTYTNAFGYPVEILIGGGTVSLIQKNSLSMAGLTSGAFTLGPSETLTVTYSVAPSARVFGL